MRYTERYERQSIPEWIDCYINYDQMKFIIKTIQDCVRERQLIQHFLTDQGQEENIQRGALSLTDEAKTTSRNYLAKLIQLGDEADQIYRKNFAESMALFFAFVQFKYEQIQGKFQKSRTFYEVTVRGDRKLNKKILIPFIQYLFVEAFSLKLMVQSNIEAERRVAYKHLANSENFYVTAPAKIETVSQLNQFDKLYQDIEKFYAFHVSQHRHGEDQYRLRKLAEIKINTPRWLFYVGILVGIFIAASFYLGVFLNYNNASLQKNSIFNRDFPVWRGIAFIILYIWSIAVNLFVYEKHSITHRFILENNHIGYPTSSKAFSFASIMSILFMVFFTMHSLNIAGVMSLGSLRPQFLPLFVWGPFLLILFNPLSLFYYRTRGYTFRMIIKVICSPCLPITFPIIWATDQLVSLFLIFQDIVYSICFYTKAQWNYNATGDLLDCRDAAALAAFIFMIIVYVYRIVQCLRVGLCDASYWKKTQFYNTFKYILSLLTGILSYVWSSNNINSVFVAWIVVAVIATIFAFGYDVYNDWDLLHRHSRNYLLRDHLTFRKSAYYICIVLNMVLRFSWIFYLSPNIVKNMLGSVEIFIFVFGSVEIVRRGIYNCIRVEVEHVRNRLCLRALPKEYERLEARMDEYLSVNRKQGAVSNTAQRIIDPSPEFFTWGQQYRENLTKRQEQLKDRIKIHKEHYWESKQRIIEIQRQESEMKNYLNQNLY